jgi:hypothetical protein
MSKHLVSDSASILDLDNPMYKVGHLEYIKRRVQFWKWRKHHTMGLPVLLLRNKSR